jgi:transcription elongation GreA/GreB family factor
MTTYIRIKADEARRLKTDSAFSAFVQEVRDDQLASFANSGAADIAAREEAHAILRALTLIEMRLDAATTAEAFLDRKQRK